MSIYCHVPYLNLEIAQETVIRHIMTLTFDRLTFQLSNSEQQLGILSDIALSTLLDNPFGQILVDLLSKLTLDLIEELDFDK